ncbi:GM19381 [Drosophila sechellia]|uniref:GD17766 n=2 Tax=melanogaster subgroup TaxID=32351 RepID=B4QYG5_DROSI|nr:GM19381 [Drosophila sechellia]EDX12810.1 GD17766 [Drosophila simulans]
MGSRWFPSRNFGAGVKRDSSSDL